MADRVNRKCSITSLCIVPTRSRFRSKTTAGRAASCCPDSTRNCELHAVAKKRECKDTWLRLTIHARISRTNNTPHLRMMAAETPSTGAAS